MMLDLGSERFCLRELRRLVARDRRYLAILLPMYGWSVRSPRRCRLLRATYFLCRHIDDALQRSTAASPVGVAGSPEVPSRPEAGGLFDR